MTIESAITKLSKNLHIEVDDSVRKLVLRHVYRHVYRQIYSETLWNIREELDG